MKINAFAPICKTGYGIHSANFFSELNETGIDVSLFPINGTVEREYTLSEKTLRNVSDMLDKSKEFDSKSVGIKLWHDVEMASFCGHYRIAYTVFETTKLSSVGLHHLNECDEVWVPSEWAKTMLELQTLTKPVYVVPEGVDPTVFKYRANTYDHSKLIACNIGKFEKRKGHFVLLEALRQVDFKMTMIAHWSNQFLDPVGIHKTVFQSGWKPVGPKRIPQISDILFEKYTSPNGNVELYLSTPPTETQKPIIDIYNYADIGIFPYFAEGWNLPLIEAMSSGLPCIATRYSGPTEYLTASNSYSIPFESLIVKEANDGVWFKGEQGNWAEVPVSVLVNFIKSVNENRDNLKAINKNLKDFGNEWSWQKAAEIAHQRLMTLEKD